MEIDQINDNVKNLKCFLIMIMLTTAAKEITVLYIEIKYVMVLKEYDT